MITSQRALERVEQFRRTMWSFDEIENWFGCDLDSAPQRLLAQFRIWATRYEDKTPVLDSNSKRIHRNIFELFLQGRELIPARLAALRWGTNLATFHNILSACLDKDLISQGELHGEFHGVYRKSFISDFHRRFPKLTRITFSSYSGYVRLLQQEIHGILGVDITPEYCATSVALRHDPLEFGYNFDCITQEPVGLGHQLWLDTKKPIQLELDECSWLTMERFFSELSGCVFGSPCEEFLLNRSSLRRYLDENC